MYRNFLISLFLIFGITLGINGAPQINNNAGTWFDTFTDGVGISASNNVAVNVISSSVSLIDGQNSGSHTTTKIEPSSFDGWVEVCLDFTAPSSTAINVDVLNGDTDSPISGYQNMNLTSPFYNPGTKCFNISGIPIANTSLKVRIDHFRDPSEAKPSINSILAKWVPKSKILIDKSGPSSVTAGGTIEYSVRYSVNFVNAQDLVIWAELPENGDGITYFEFYGQNDSPTFVSATSGGQYTAGPIVVGGTPIPANSVYWNVGSLTAGSSVILKYRVGTISGTLNGTQFTADANFDLSNGDSGVSNSVVTTITSTPGPSINKVSSSGLYPIDNVNYAFDGSTIKFRINLTNTGSERLYNGVMWDNLDNIDPLPLGAVIAAPPTVISNGGAYTAVGTTVNGVPIPANSVYWNIQTAFGALNPGAFFSPTFELNLTTQGGPYPQGPYTNDVSVDSDQQPSVVSDTYDFVVVDILPRKGTGSKTFSPSSAVEYGTFLNSTLTWRNDGGGLHRDIVIYDRVSDDMTFFSASSTIGDVWYLEDNTGTYINPNTHPPFDWNSPATTPGLPIGVQWSMTPPVDDDAVNESIWIAVYIDQLTTTIPGLGIPFLPTTLDIQWSGLVNAPGDICDDAIIQNVGITHVYNYTDDNGVPTAYSFPPSGTELSQVITRNITATTFRPRLSLSGGISGGDIVPGTGTYTINATNFDNGSNESITNVTLTLTLPQININGVMTYLTLVPIVGGDGIVTSISPGQIIFDFGTLTPSGGSQTKSQSFLFSLPIGSLIDVPYTIAAYGTGDTSPCGEVNGNHVVSKTATGEPLIQVFKSDVLDLILPGGDIIYELNYRNIGEVPSTNTWVIDRIPYRTVFDEAYPVNGEEVWFTDKLPPVMPTDEVSVTVPLTYDDIITHFAPGILNDGGTPFDFTDDVVTSPFGELTTWVAFKVDYVEFTPALLPVNPITRAVQYLAHNDEIPGNAMADNSVAGTVIINDEAIFSNQNIQAIGNQVQTTVSASASLSITKESTIEIASIGETFDWIVNYYNNSESIDDVVTLTDIVPQDMIIESIEHIWNDDYSPTPGGSTTLYTAAPFFLDPSTTITPIIGGLEVEILVAGTATGDELDSDGLLAYEGGQLIITVTPALPLASGDEVYNVIEGYSENGAGSHFISASDLVTIYNPDLNMIKGVSRDDPNNGEIITYYISIANEGFHDADGVVIEDVMLFGAGSATYVPSSTLMLTSGYSIGEPTVTPAAGSLTLTWSDLTQDGEAAGYLPGISGPILFQYQLQINGVSDDDFDNIVTGTLTNPFEDPDFPNSDTLEVIIPFPDPQVLKFGPSISEAGAQVKWRIVFLNDNNYDADNVYLIETLPAVNPGVNTDVIFISQIVPPTLTPYFHDGDVAVQPTFDPLDPLAVANGWTATPGSVVNHIAYNVIGGTLVAESPPQLIEILVELREPITNVLPPAGATFVNSVEIFTSSTDDDNTNNTATATTRIPGVDIALAKVGSEEGLFPGLRPGDDISYTFTILNSGTVNAIGLYVTDTLPDFFIPDPFFSDFNLIEVVDVNGDPLFLLDENDLPIPFDIEPTLVGTVAPGEQLIWYLGSTNPLDPDYYREVGIPSGGFVRWTIYGTVSTAAVDGDIVTNGAEATYEGIVLNPIPEDYILNNVDTSFVQILQPDLYIAKSVVDILSNSFEYTSINDTLLYTITFNNIGNADADDACINENVPEGTTYVDGSLIYPGGGDVTFIEDGFGNIIEIEICYDVLPAPGTFDGGVVEDRDLYYRGTTLDDPAVLCDGVHLSYSDSLVVIGSTILTDPPLAAHSVNDIGDIDGNGVPDYIIGQRFDTPYGANSGSAYIILMDSDNTILNSERIGDGECVLGRSSGDQFGYSVEGIGDVDFNGVPDILVGAPFDTPYGGASGSAYIILLDTNGTPGNVSSIGCVRIGDDEGLLGRSGGDRFGWDVAGIGDVDFNGIPDILVGAWGDTPFAGNNSGSAYVLLLGSSGFGNVSVIGSQRIGDSDDAGEVGDPSPTGGNRGGGGFTGDRFGYSVAGIGDIDGNGSNDIIIGAYNDEGFAGYPIGGLSPVWFDGTAYVVLLESSGAGNVTVKSSERIGDADDPGDAGTIVPSYMSPTPSDGRGSSGCCKSNADRFGWSVAGIGDVNGDGINDVLVGSPGDEPFSAANFEEGSAYIIFLNSDGTPLDSYRVGENGQGFDAPFNRELNDRFGYSVDGLGDINGDGIADIVVGAREFDSSFRYNNGARPRGGGAWVILLNNDGSPKDVVGMPIQNDGSEGDIGDPIARNDVSGYQYIGEDISAAGDYLNIRHGDYGDINGDGYRDFIVGATATSGFSVLLEIPGFASQGTFATPVFSNNNLAWDRLFVNQDLPLSTTATYSLYPTFDVNDGCTGAPFPAHTNFTMEDGFRDISDISPFDYPTFCLEANLTTAADPPETPCFDRWSATYVSDTLPTITFKTIVNDDIVLNEINNTVQITTPTLEIGEDNNISDDIIFVQNADLCVEKNVDKAAILFEDSGTFDSFESGLGNWVNQPTVNFFIDNSNRWERRQLSNVDHELTVDNTPTLADCIVTDLFVPGLLNNEFTAAGPWINTANTAPGSLASDGTFYVAFDSFDPTRGSAENCSYLTSFGFSMLDGIEASSNAQRSGLINTNIFDGNKLTEISFDYHYVMRYTDFFPWANCGPNYGVPGCNNGDLRLQISTTGGGGPWVDLWSKIRPHESTTVAPYADDEWKSVTIDLTGYTTSTNVRFRFVAYTGYRAGSPFSVASRSHYGQPNLDNIKITSGGITGNPVTYTINYVNNGAQDGDNTQLIDVLPAFATLISASVAPTTTDPDYQSSGRTALIWDLGPLAPGESGTITLTVELGANAFNENVATIGSDLLDLDPLCNQDIGLTYGLAAEIVNLYIYKDGDTNVFLGDTSTYVITYGNNGNLADTNVSITDVLPLGFTPISAVDTYDATPSILGQTVTANVGTLNPGDTGTLTITYVVDSNNDNNIVLESLENTATIDGDATLEADEFDNSDSHDVFVNYLKASVSGIVWDDIARNDIFDIFEPGIPGVLIYLSGTDFLGNPVLLTQTTGANGEYTFAGLNPGTYVVEEVQPSPYTTITPTDVGDVLDWGSSPAAITPDVGVVGVGVVSASNEAFTTIDVGFAENGVEYNFGEFIPAPVGPVEPPVCLWLTDFQNGVVVGEPEDFTYAPDIGFTGIDYAQYVIICGGIPIDTSTVFITVPSQVTFDITLEDFELAIDPCPTSTVFDYTNFNTVDFTPYGGGLETITSDAEIIAAFNALGIGAEINGCVITINAPTNNGNLDVDEVP